MEVKPWIALEWQDVPVDIFFSYVEPTDYVLFILCWNMVELCSNTKKKYQLQKDMASEVVVMVKWNINHQTSIVKLWVNC